MAADGDASAGSASRDRPVWFLVFAIGSVAAALTVLIARTLHRPHLPVSLPWLLLAVGFGVAEICVVHLHVGRETHSFSLGEVPLVVGLFFVAPLTVVAARLCGAVVALVVHRRQPVLKLCFNGVQWWLETACALLAWHTIVGHGSPLSPRGWLATFVAIAVVDVLAALAIAAAIRLRTGRTSRRELLTSLSMGSATALVNTCLALVAVDVFVVDVRGAWVLVVVGFVFFAAHRGHSVLRERHAALEQLSIFSKSVGSDLRVDVVVHEVLHHVRELLQAETVELVLDTTFAGRPLAFRYAGAEVLDIAVDDAVAAPVAGPAPRFPALRRTSSADVLTAMLRVRNEQIGRLTVVGRQGDVARFGRVNQNLLEALAGHAGAALDNGRLADRLRTQVQENAYQATHDALTGLCNRQLFEKEVAAAAATTDGAAVLLLDLDRFKEVNDTLGHAAGDDLLREVAARLLAVLPRDACVARLGGDEFAVLLSGADVEQARRCAAAIRASVQQRFCLREIDLTVDASVGIAVATGTGTRAETLLQRADVAMYAAKEDRSGVEVYDPTLDGNSAERLALVAELRDALTVGGLRVVYQPKGSLADNAVHGVEALVRWDHPTRGPVPPDDFVPICEQTGLVGPLTDFVLGTALRQCAAWRQAGLRLGVSVNLSPRSLLDPALPTRVSAALAAAGLPPAVLTLEVTEGGIMAEPERAVAMLWELRALGVRLSIDDLGVGYSSLAYLKNLPVHEVKVDKSFVRGMANDPDDDAIVTALVELVHRLRMTCVAEGVEDETTWRRLTAIGCDAAQGYWLAAPMAGDALVHWLHRDDRPVPALPGSRRDGGELGDEAVDLLSDPLWAFLRQ